MNTIIRVLFLCANIFCFVSADFLKLCFLKGSDGYQPTIISRDLTLGGAMQTLERTIQIQGGGMSRSETIETHIMYIDNDAFASIAESPEKMNLLQNNLTDIYRAQNGGQAVPLFIIATLVGDDLWMKGLCNNVILRSANDLGAARVLTDADEQMRAKVFEVVDLVLH